MTTTVRYKFVENTTGNAFTKESFLDLTDGEDRQLRIIKRVLSADDIGEQPGETGHDYGAIVDVIPSNYNVLWFQGTIYRKNGAIQGSTLYNPVDNQYNSDDVSSFEAEYFLGTDNTLRVRSVDDDLPCFIGDVVTFFVILGPRTNPNDKVNG